LAGGQIPEMNAVGLCLADRSQGLAVGGEGECADTGQVEAADFLSGSHVPYPDGLVVADRQELAIRGPGDCSLLINSRKLPQQLAAGQLPDTHSLRNAPIAGNQRFAVRG